MQSMLDCMDSNTSECLLHQNRLDIAENTFQAKHVFFFAQHDYNWIKTHHAFGREAQALQEHLIATLQIFLLLTDDNAVPPYKIKNSSKK